jgi:hypothetical protein
VVIQLARQIAPVKVDDPALEELWHAAGGWPPISSLRPEQSRLSRKLIRISPITTPTTPEIEHLLPLPNVAWFEIRASDGRGKSAKRATEH